MNWKFWKTSYYGGADTGLITKIFRGLLALAALYLLAAAIIGIWWSREPGAFDVSAYATELARADGATNPETPVVGYTTTAALYRVASTLLEKPGGYLTNDIAPPGVWLDNQPSWEFGVVTQIRDMSRAMRLDFSRSQSQSAEDPDLGEAEGKYFFDASSWILPQTEDEYREGNKLVRSYLKRLADPAKTKAQFYARADNLQKWLQGVESRLGNLSQQLSASVGKRQLDLGLAGDPSAAQSTSTPSEEMVQTPWLELDNVFYEARGHTWALLHLLRAIEVDFKDVLEDKNALVSLGQIIRELEGTQESVMSPMILNGEGLGLLANHSLVMASYISRANAGIIDLRELLSRG
ncbi:MAG: DUF2333 family protein [Pseudomonadota bacterium]